MDRWEEVHETTTKHSFTFRTVEDGPVTVMALFRNVAPSQAASQLCGEVAFRAMLDTIGIPWRKMLGSDGSDSGTRPDDLPDPQ